MLFKNDLINKSKWTAYLKGVNVLICAVTQEIINYFGLKLPELQESNGFAPMEFGAYARNVVMGDLLSLCNMPRSDFMKNSMSLYHGMLLFLGKI
jgi:hypothetical protein